MCAISTFFVGFIVLASSLPFERSIQQNISKHQNKNIRVLHVASTPYKPFMSLDADAQYDKGIEFELLELIAKRENAKLWIENLPTKLQ